VDQSNHNENYLHISNVEVKNYGREGIKIITAGGNSSLSDVKIQNSSLHDNLYGGLKVTGSGHNRNHNYVVDHVTAYNSPGQGRGSVTGSGIFLADVDNATITRCVVHDTGLHGAAPVGIWSAGSNRVTIQYCESYNNHT